VNTINELFVKQKKIIRIINKQSYNAHTQPLFCQCEILPLPSLIKFSQLQFMHMYSHNLLPQAFGNPWPTNADRREEQEVANLRNSENVSYTLSENLE
jgi:hypothetical protein